MYIVLSEATKEYLLCPNMPGGSAPKATYRLLNMLQGLFKSETIEDYTCVKCSIVHYLQTKGSKINSPAMKQFLEKLVADRNELDED